MDPVPSSPIGGDEAATPPVPASGPLVPKRLLWIELLVVLSLAVVPDLLGAVAYLVRPTPPTAIVFDTVGIIARSVPVVAVVLYLMWRSPEGLAGFGVRRPRALRDSALAIGLFAAGWVSHYLIWTVLWQLPGLDDLYLATGPQDAGPFLGPRTGLDYGALVVLGAVNGVAEQLVISAYLVTRLESLLGSPRRAVLAASLLFTSYHVYQGVWALASIFVFGVLFTAAFAACRRLWPVAIGHGLTDIAAYLQM